jgi:pseudouridine synthase
MGFTRKIQYYLVHTLKYSNKEALLLIKEGKVKVNNMIIYENILLNSEDEIKINHKIVKATKSFVYIKYYKPVGLVSSLNKNVPHSLYSLFEKQLPLFIAGRLDKSSEGLLILTNDGKWLKKITDPNAFKEKEYIVELDKTFNENFLKQMRTGVDIKFYVTRPCFCEKINDTEFRIILTEGKNKQIRRMCKFFGYQVIRLKRIRIDTIMIKKMNPNDCQLLNL